MKPGTLNFIGSTQEIHIGAVIVDRYSELAGVVQSIDGYYITMKRPAGRVRRVYYRRVRPATDYEKRQLVALGKLRQQQQREAL